MKLILAIAATAAMVFAAGTAAAQARNTTLPDGTIVSVVTSRSGGFFRSQESSQLVFLCSPSCELVQASSSSNPGIVPGLLQSAINGFSIVEAARVLRPSESYVSNYADGGRADAYAEGGRGGSADASAESWSDTYVRNEPTITVTNRAPATLPPAPPAPCCAPPILPPVVPPIVPPSSH